MKIFKHSLSELIDELIAENGNGHVWINTGFCDDLDPSTWTKPTINSPLKFVVARPYDAQNKFWLKCLMEEVPANDLHRAFPADKHRRTAWILAGYD